MADEWVRWILSGLGGVIALMFGEMIRRLFKLVDGKANKDSTDARFEQLIGELKQQRDEQRADLRSHEEKDIAMHKDMLTEIRETNREQRETNRQLAMTNVTLSNLVGRFDATNGQR